jgi:transcriptional regulator GlxA family with amidase domain
LIDDLCRAARSGGPSPERDWLHSAKLALLARSGETVDLRGLAASSGIGYSSFRRRFKALTGFSPHQFLLAIRINRAKALLRETRRTAADIAAATGFASPAYFARYFKRAAGLSPLAWRERERAGRERETPPAPGSGL